jgi:hypothetical protein
MSKNTTNVNHSDLPCTCGTLEQYVDGLCPGCIETADRTADLNNECIYPQPTGNAFPQEMIDDAFEGDDESAVREGDDDRYYSGSGESMDDESYERYLNRG